MPESISLTSEPLHICHPAPKGRKTSVHRSHSREPTNSEADTLIIAKARGPICSVQSSNDQTARISLQISRNVKQQRNKTNRSRQSYLAPNSQPFQNSSAPFPKQKPYLAIQQQHVKSTSQRSLRCLPAPRVNQSGFPVPASVPAVR